MAQTGFTPILLYASGTASAAPTAGNLTSSASGAELALNYADGKLFYKDSGGVVQVLATKATGTIGGSTTQVQYNNGGVLAGSANLTFDGTTLSVGGPITLTNNLGFTSTQQRITGDMSSGTAINRLAFQTSTTNGSSTLSLLPNGTATAALLAAFNNSDPTNGSYAGLFVSASEARLMSARLGTGTFLPLTFYTNGSEQGRIETNGNWLVATTSTGADGLGVSNLLNLTFPEGSGTSYANLFRQASSGATVLANGYKRSATASGFASSVGTSWAKTAIGLGVGTGAITFYTDAAGTVANGTDVTPTERARITSTGNFVAGGSVALATTATDGFLYVPTCAGTPTGTPTAITGMAPIVVDTTNNKMYFYSGGAWRDAGP